MIGTPYITVHVNIAEKLTIGHTNNTGEHFNAFIKDGVTVVGQDTIVYQPAQSEHHEVKAVFTDTSDVYEAVLSTVGSGYISFEVAGKLSGTYSGPGYSLYVDVTNALDIGNEPDDSFFQYYEIVQGPSRTIDIGPELTVPAGSQGSRGIIAFFTDDDTTGYAVTLSTKGNGYITFSLDGGVTTGRFMSSGQTQTYVLHADALDTVTIGNIPMAGHFQFFVYNGSLDVAKTAAGSFDVTENAVAEACFTSTGSTYSLTMAPVGGGHVDFSLGHGTYSIYSIITIPADSGTTVAASAVADAGVFRFNVYDSETYLQSSINMNESGGAHVLTSYFTADASLTEYLTVGITGEGRVDLDIVTVGTPIPTIRGFIGSVPMEPTDSVTLSAVETSPRYVFDSWAEDADGEPRVFTVTMSGDYGATAVFMYKGNPDRPSYVITATSSTDRVISPNGKISVLQGDGITFEFHANDGYIIATVQVDGTALSKEEVESGRYTFSDVNSNHTIHVVGMGPESVLLLVIDIGGGAGVPK